MPTAADGEFSALATYEHLDSSEIETGEDRDTVGLDLQETLHPWRQNKMITWPFAAEVNTINVTGSPWLSYTTPKSNTIFTGVFAQDEFTLVPDKLSVTLGTKEERNSFSGWEDQPSLRAIWHP